MVIPLVILSQNPSFTTTIVVPEVSLKMFLTDRLLIILR